MSIHLRVFPRVCDSSNIWKVAADKSGSAPFIFEQQSGVSFVFVMISIGRLTILIFGIDVAIVSANNVGVRGPLAGLLDVSDAQPPPNSIMLPREQLPTTTRSIAQLWAPLVHIKDLSGCLYHGQVIRRLHPSGVLDPEQCLQP
jgi:hypothetical protein